MLYFSLLIAFFSTLAYCNIMIVDICNSKHLTTMQYDENFVKQAKFASLLRWFFILLMSIFWPLSIILF